MKHPHLTTLAVIGLFVLGPNAISQTPEARIPGDPVKIDSGLISGKLVSGNVKAYLGIPYAAPPVGNLRWR